MWQYKQKNEVLLIQQTPEVAAYPVGQTQTLLEHVDDAVVVPELEVQPTVVVHDCPATAEVESKQLIINSLPFLYMNFKR